jgi:hypothetical protein
VCANVLSVDVVCCCRCRCCFCFPANILMCYGNDSDRSTIPPAFPAATAASFVIYHPSQPMKDTIAWWNGCGGLPGAISICRPSSASAFDSSACSRAPLSPIFQIITWSSGSMERRTPGAQMPFVPPQDPYNTVFGVAGSDLRRCSISRPVSPRQTGQLNVPLRQVRSTSSVGKSVLMGMDKLV